MIRQIRFLFCIGLILAYGYAEADESVIIEPELLGQPAPKYPPAAVQQNLCGSVGFELSVDESGDVVNAVIVNSTNSIFEENALAAVLKGKYVPAMKNGQAVPYKGVKSNIEFEIEGVCQKHVSYPADTCEVEGACNRNGLPHSAALEVPECLQFNRKFRDINATRKQGMPPLVDYSIENVCDFPVVFSACLRVNHKRKCKKGGRLRSKKSITMIYNVRYSESYTVEFEKTVCNILGRKPGNGKPGYRVKLETTDVNKEDLNVQGKCIVEDYK